MEGKDKNKPSPSLMAIDGNALPLSPNNAINHQLHLHNTL